LVKQLLRVFGSFGAVKLVGQASGQQMTTLGSILSNVMATFAECELHEVQLAECELDLVRLSTREGMAIARPNGKSNVRQA
jgi:hypothetical protein